MRVDVLDEDPGAQRVLEQRRVLASELVAVVSEEAAGLGRGAERLVVQGRPVQITGDRLYWLFVGFDFLEIRSMAIPTAGP